MSHLKDHISMQKDLREDLFDPAEDLLAPNFSLKMLPFAKKELCEDLFVSMEDLLDPTDDLFDSTEDLLDPTDDLFISTEDLFDPTEDLLDPFVIEKVSYLSFWITK